MSGKIYWAAIESICEKIEIYETPEKFLEDFKKVPLLPGLIFAVHFMDSEVCNGGFEQLFFNSTGILAPEAEIGLKEIGFKKCSEALKTAMALFGSQYPRDRKERNALLDKIGKNEKKVFLSLEDQYFQLRNTEIGKFEKAIDEFVLKRIEEFPEKEKIKNAEKKI